MLLPNGVSVAHVKELLRDRAAARLARDFDTADRLRAELRALGLAVEDSGGEQTLTTAVTGGVGGGGRKRLREPPSPSLPLSSPLSAVPSTRSAPSSLSSPSHAVGKTSALLFDLNYTEQTTDGEAGALCRQLNYSFAANRRAPCPFPLLLVGGKSVPAEETPGETAASAAAGAETGPAAVSAVPPPLAPDAPRLIQLLHKSNWWSAPCVQRCRSSTPWDVVAEEGQRLIYLTADSPHELFTDKSTIAGAREAASLAEQTVFVIGGLVDRVRKPGMSFARATAAGLRTARLPLGRFLRLHVRDVGKVEGDATGADITTLAVVQILLLFRETRDWGLAVSRCPALRCAPLRKYVRWLPPYEHLNSAERPHDFRNVDGDEKERRQEGAGLAAVHRTGGSYRLKERDAGTDTDIVAATES